MDPFADGTADILEAMGVSAVYKPQGGAEVETTVVFDTGIESAGGQVSVAEGVSVLSCLRKDVGLPASGDVFTTGDGTDYTVDGYPEDEEAGDEHLVRVIVR